MRDEQHLNFKWYFKPFETQDIKAETFDDFSIVNIPHNAVDIPLNHFDERMTHGVFSYVKEIKPKEDWKNKIVQLKFEGVAHQATIYLNQNLIGQHKGGYIPFVVDLTAHLSYDSPNICLVVVDTHEDESIAPFGGVVDFLGYGGIYREVTLEILEKEHIKDVWIQTTQPLQKDEGDVVVTVSKNSGILNISIFDMQKNEVFEAVLKVENRKFKVPFVVQNKQLWSLSNPYLYTMVLSFYQGKVLKDQVTERFGFRQAEFKTEGFYLNGELIKLIGLNRHQSYPYVGYAMPKHVQYEDAELLKYDLGIDCVRTAHYPQSKHFINRCDEIGLLVFEEMPGWQHIGNDAWKEQSLNNVTQMILRDRNHPSIIIWGVRINESPDDDSFYQKTNQLAHMLDPTRPTGGVRNMAFSSFLEDVYTYNDFSHQGHNAGLEKKKKITKNVPYLVTEYNGHMFPTKRYDDEPHRLSHALRHLNVMNTMSTPNNGISGAIGWCMNDYNTHKEFGSGDRVCYHGVLDMFRIPKLAAYSYASQRNLKPYLEIASDINIGEYPASKLTDIHVFTNMDYIKLYKNDVYIKTFYPAIDRYPNLLHPPVIVDDFIGDLLIEQENMSEKDSEIVKSLFKAVMNYGPHLPLVHKLKFLYILKKYKLTNDQAVKMFFKYVSGWGSSAVSYRFEGYVNNELIKTVIKENHQSFDFKLSSSRAELVIGHTYDAQRFIIQKVDQNDQQINYAFDPLEIKVSGPIELIGPVKVSLQGGAIAFWVRTKQEKGKGTITVLINGKSLNKEVIVK